MSTQSENLLAIANAIRAKEGSSEPIPATQFPERILAIETGTDTSDATATADDILSGKTAYVASGKVTGSIASKNQDDLLTFGPTVTVPAGFYATDSEKSVDSVDQAAPAISVSSGGLVTAECNQPAGYVAEGVKSSTMQLDTIGAQTIVPGATDKAINPGVFVTGKQTIKGDANLKSANIKSGVSIFGVLGSGTMLGEQISFRVDYQGSGNIGIIGVVTDVGVYYGDSSNGVYVDVEAHIGSVVTVMIGWNKDDYDPSFSPNSYYGFTYMGRLSETHNAFAAQVHAFLVANSNATLLRFEDD